MDYERKLRRLDEHLAEHPKDYQAVISRLKTKSDAIEHEMHKNKIERLQRVAEIKRQMKEGRYGSERV